MEVELEKKPEVHQKMFVTPCALALIRFVSLSWGSVSPKKHSNIKLVKKQAFCGSFISLPLSQTYCLELSRHSTNYGAVVRSGNWVMNL